MFDARGADLKKAAPLDEEPVVWQNFTNPDLPNKGQLLAELTPC